MPAIDIDQGSPVSQASSVQRSKVRNTWISAFSNLSTAYNLVNINLAHVIMENEYCSGNGCPDAVTVASTACLVGAILGQLTFGYVGDCLGRSRALQLTMVLSILGALVSAFAVPLDSSDPSSVFTFLSISRLVLGIGVGGVYPLAATIAAESSGAHDRGRTVSLVFSMQGVGTLLVPLVGMVFLYSFGTELERAAAGKALPGISWRLVLGVGAVPGMILFPLKAVNSAGPNSPMANSPMARPSLSLLEALRMRAYWVKIIGCAGGWFLFDITFYGNTLFAPTVLHYVFHEGSLTPTIGDTLRDNLCWQLAVLALIGLPGYYMSVWLMDRVGRKAIQLQGFVFMAIIYAILGFYLNSLKDYSGLLLFVYGLTYFFSNFGPNSTTFILPSETFPAEVRSSLNGFCAASGKIGAAIGSSTFKPIVHASGAGIVFQLCALVAVLGVLVTVFCVEDRRGRGMEGDNLVEGRSDPALESGFQVNMAREQEIPPEQKERIRVD
mmetsp:Transcript_29426/g.62644  ORF Transcript_29426/g.62644 Transcript_29426/m.62644 type:complete len:497 (-) Transcript_29426:13-1503(-)